MRPQGWETRLDAALWSFEGAAFEWGRTDCVRFAIAMVEAMMGEAPLQIDTEYSDKAGAAMAIRSYGGGGILLACLRLAEERGWAAVPVRYAQRGDLAHLDGVDGSSPFVGIVDLSGRRIASMQEGGGMVRFPVQQAAHTWRIA